MEIKIEMKEMQETMEEARKFDPQQISAAMAAALEKTKQDIKAEEK